MQGRRILIIGVHKGGTTSLQKHYEAQGCDVIRNTQLFTRWDGPDIYKQKYSDRIPIVILRDPVERAWADYHHRLRRDMIWKDIPYEEYCVWHSTDHKLGTDYLKLGQLNIIEISKYQQWLDNWKEVNPLVLWLEFMKQDPKFPSENKGGWHVGITEKQKEFTRELINETN